jgi:hypothetical protein
MARIIPNKRSVIRIVTAMVPHWIWLVHPSTINLGACASFELKSIDAKNATDGARFSID